MLQSVKQPDIEIDIAVEHEAWGNVENFRQIIEKAVKASISIADLNLPQECELSILLTGDEQMQAINHQWRNMNKPTNVLSFPGSDMQIGDLATASLGDIVLSHETLMSEIEDNSKSFEDHFTHLIVHGFLHLFGYDHENDKEALVMEGLETKILDDLGIQNPYGLDN